MVLIKGNVNSANLINELPKIRDRVSLPIASQHKSSPLKELAKAVPIYKTHPRIKKDAYKLIVNISR